MKDVASFRLQGDLTFATVANINPKDFMAEAQRVELDLADVEKADSAGVAWLIDWYGKTRVLSPEVRCINIGAQLAQLLEVYEIDFIT